MGSLCELLASWKKMFQFFPNVFFFFFFSLTFSPCTLPPAPTHQKKKKDNPINTMLLVILLSLSGSEIFFHKLIFGTLFFPQSCLTFSRFSFALFHVKQSKFWCRYLVMLCLADLFYVSGAFRFSVSCLFNLFLKQLFCLSSFRTPQHPQFSCVSIELTILGWKSCFCLL